MLHDNLQFASQPSVSVGILSATEINVTLEAAYTDSASGTTVQGPQSFSVAPDGTGVVWQGEIHREVMLTPAEGQGCTFEVADVVIGVGFHWERRENQRFSGSLKIIVENGRITLINILPVEDYLLSVISSEMSATASLELLKAHAVISRGWLLAQIVKNREIAAGADNCGAEMIENDSERVRWYDREDHLNFDVCADDHCQRYQGVTRQSTARVAEAIAATKGLALTADGRLCDTRFSKCCGGVFEEFENCWEPQHHSYLVARRDNTNPAEFPDLRDEKNAREWIMHRPDAFCHTNDKKILSQVLNNYDQETTDFYRWEVNYSRAGLSALVRERSGIDFGEIRDLQPVERGTSGRIIRLRIVGTRRTMVIGKELEIRRTLSPSHLYSSAFVVERGAPDSEGLPESFTLYGAGWGHGVGLCQIGAAVMGEQGYGYEAILAHYFPGAALTRLY